MSNEKVELYLKFKKYSDSDLAIYAYDGDISVWLPKSQIKCLEEDLDDLLEGKMYLFEIPEWLAQEKDLI